MNGTSAADSEGKDQEEGELLSAEQLFLEMCNQLVCVRARTQRHEVLCTASIGQMPLPR